MHSVLSPRSHPSRLPRLIARHLILTAYICAIALLFDISFLAYEGSYTQASNSSGHSGNRDEDIRDCLMTVRSQIELYRIQHGGIPASPAEGWNQLLYPTNITGATSATHFPGYIFGPYVQAKPVNPANGQAEIGTSPSTTIGWVYSVSGRTYTIQPVNTTGNAVLTY